MVTFLADAELAIRNPSHALDYAVTWMILYYLRNWLPFWALLPDSKDAMLELVDDIECCAEHDDREALPESVHEIRDLVDGGRQTPEGG